jgi:hypothetical protein
MMKEVTREVNSLSSNHLIIRNLESFKVLNILFQLYLIIEEVIKPMIIHAIARSNELSEKERMRARMWERGFSFGRVHSRSYK